MNEDLKCSKCGQRVLPNWKWCLSCGQPINNSEEDETLSLDDEPRQTYGFETSFKPLNIVFLIMFILSIIPIILSYKLGGFKSNMILPDYFNEIISSLFLVGDIIIMFYFYCIARIVKKAGEKWWLLCIPIVGIFYYLYISYKLAYNKILFPFLLIIVSFIVGLAVIILPFICIKYNLSLWNLIKVLKMVEIVLDVIIGFLSALSWPIIISKFGRNLILALFFSFVLLPTVALSDKYQYDYRN